jgi:hypothetical protein
MRMKYLIYVLMAMFLVIGVSAGGGPPSEADFFAVRSTCYSGAVTNGWDAAVNDGNYGGLPESEFCLVRGTQDCGMSPPVVATATLYFPGGPANVVVRHLDGMSNLDNFDVMVGTTVIGSYVDKHDSTEVWETTNFPITIAPGSYLVTIISTDAAWEGCPTWGQLAIDYINVEPDEDNDVPEFGLIAGAIALIGVVAGAFILRKRN